MAKRVYSESIKKWAKATGYASGSAGLIFLIFNYLLATGVITDFTFSPDSVCAGTETDPCYAYINFTANEDIFIYPTGYDPYGRNSTFEFDPALKSWKLQRSWGSGWRSYDLNRPCTGTWCGLSDKNDERKFSLVWRKDRDYQLRIMAFKHDPFEDVKWGGFDGLIDPVWKGLKGDSKGVIHEREDKVVMETDRGNFTVNCFTDGDDDNTFKDGMDRYVTNYTGGVWKFGAYSNLTGWNEHKCIIKSESPITFRDGRYHIKDGNGYFKYDDRDICPATHPITGESVPCEYELETVTSKEIGEKGELVDVPEYYLLETVFWSEQFIDPSWTSENAGTQAFGDQVLFEGDNSSHLSVNDTDVLGYYTFDTNISTSTVYDMTSNNQDGSVTAGSPNFVADGKIGGAWIFNAASTEKLEIGTGSDFSTMENGFTFSAWGNPDGNTATELILGRYDTVGDNRFFRFGAQSTNDLFFDVYEDGTTTNCVIDYNGADWSSGVWKHLVGVYATDGSNSNISVYSDGVFRTSTTCSFGNSVLE
jgi:hypothetical protein